METVVANVNGIIADGQPRKLLPVIETESFSLFCQKFDGKHSFRHLNEQHDEVIYVISGKLNIWTADGTFELGSGESIKIPKGLEHGDLVGKDVEILVIDGKL